LHFNANCLACRLAIRNAGKFFSKFVRRLFVAWRAQQYLLLLAFALY